MTTVNFATILQRHLSCPPREVSGRTVAEALRAVFAENPRLEGYILDDQGALRKHVAISVDGRMIRDRSLDTPLEPDSEIYVLQSLTGG